MPDIQATLKPNESENEINLNEIGKNDRQTQRTRNTYSNNYQGHMQFAQIPDNIFPRVCMYDGWAWHNVIVMDMKNKNENGKQLMSSVQCARASHLLHRQTDCDILCVFSSVAPKLRKEK